MCENSRKRKHSGHEGSTTVKGVFKRDDFDDSLSTSDWNLIIDENPKPKKRRPPRLKEYPLTLKCLWNNCDIIFNNFDKFNRHLKEHAEDYIIDDDDGNGTEYNYKCIWEKCNVEVPTIQFLWQHLCFHGYQTKLKCIGTIIIERLSLPDCITGETFVIPDKTDLYRCEWKKCDEVFLTIVEFFNHVKLHVFHNPRGPKEGQIVCLWKGCTSSKFVSQYKLAEHLRKHTKERVVACPTCGLLFTCNTKFCDHRKRQLPMDLQSYLCSQCSKYFPSERLLRDHMRLHVNQYKCSMCEMTCPKPSILAKHFRFRHMTEKPFKCAQCDYRCVAKHNLDVHMKTHNVENEFKCSECNYECRSSFALGRHLQKHGLTQRNIYECHNCKKRFGRGGVLTKHLMKVHNYHWPSGHSRFRYKEDQDGIYRLQTVRYETLDVTEEIMKGQTVQPPPKPESLHFRVTRKEPEDDHSIEAFIVEIIDKEQALLDQQELDRRELLRVKQEREEEEFRKETKQVLITIDDLDSKGNILKSQVIESSEIICPITPKKL